MIGIKNVIANDSKVTHTRVKHMQQFKDSKVRSEAVTPVIIYFTDGSSWTDTIEVFTYNRTQKEGVKRLMAKTTMETFRLAEKLLKEKLEEVV